MKKLMILDKEQFPLDGLCAKSIKMRVLPIKQGAFRRKTQGFANLLKGENFRVLLLRIVGNKWKIHSLKIKSTFLQGNKIYREVYLKAPVEAGTSKLWKLNISVYGLYDAPRTSYLSLKYVLLRAGATKTKFDDSAFLWTVNNKLQGVMCCHVEGFCWEGQSNFNQQ